MGSFTSRPKMEAKDHQDGTIEIPEDEFLLDWVKEQQGKQYQALFNRRYRHNSGREEVSLEYKSIRILQWNILAQGIGS